MKKQTQHPWVEGRAEMDRMYGDLALRARQWMIAALVSMTVSIVLAVGMVTLVTTDRNVPYIVELDQLGELRVVGEIATQEVPERARRATLHRVVTHMRQIPTDARILRAQHSQARAHMTGEAAMRFNSDLRSSGDQLNRMLSQGAQRYVREIKSLLPYPGEPGLYRVTWTEESKGMGTGAPVSYEGHFHIQDNVTLAPEQAIHNPLGIFITDYSITPIISADS